MQVELKITMCRRLNTEREVIRVRDKIQGVSWAVEDCINGEVFLMAIVEGPAESPYEGGVFRISVRLPADYPFKRPYFKLLTPLYHPLI